VYLGPANVPLRIEQSLLLIDHVPIVVDENDREFNNSVVMRRRQPGGLDDDHSIVAHMHPLATAKSPLGSSRSRLAGISTFSANCLRETRRLYRSSRDGSSAWPASLLLEEEIAAYQLKSPFDALQMDAQGALIRDRWAILDLNQWPLPCQGSALPLS
jgi:hypothetical protein